MDQPLLVSLNNKYYDIAKFANKHPGGEKVLRMLAGSDVTNYMNGSKRIINVKHAHSAAAYGILERYSINCSYKKDTLLDSKNAILWRVGNLKEKYWLWIHQPYDGTLRLFNSNFLECLTKTPWWLVPLVWLPIVFIYFFIGINIMCAQFNFIKGFFISFSIFFFGMLAWTLLEYILHRFVFHWQPNPTSYNQITLHFLLHGLHHKTPMDDYRLVFPPVAAAIIAVFFYFFYYSILPWSIFCCYASGKLLGYICYDMIHYYLHYGSPSPYSNMHFRKVYHHNHHFKDFNLAFGISTTIWDFVFGTVGSGPTM